LLVTGVVWCLDFFFLRSRRRANGVAAMASVAPAIEGLEPSDAARIRQEAYDNANRAPWGVEYCVSFFPVILFVFALRSFVVEPFRILSGSMLPTLQNGDLILVNEFRYGTRLPVIDKNIIDIGEHKRGDVIVFRYPVDPDVDYIKRVGGLPGDVVQYQNKVLTVNGNPVRQVRDGDYFEPA